MVTPMEVMFDDDRYCSGRVDIRVIVSSTSVRSMMRNLGTTERISPPTVAVL
jgi:hypothetical protein